MRMFNDYKDYIDDLINHSFNYIIDKDIVRQNAYICFMHFLNSYKNIDESDFIDVINKQFYDYVFTYNVHNIDLFNSYYDRVSIAIRVVFNYYKRNKMYPKVKNIFKLYRISKTNAYNLLVYASEYLDIELENKALLHETNINFEDEYLKKESNKYLFNQIKNSTNLDDMELQILLMKSGYLKKSISNGYIAKIIGCEKEKVEEKYTYLIKKLVRDYNDDYFC